MAAPRWKNPDMHVYPASMTAIIRTSDYIRPDITADDQLAAFIGTECRGVAEQIEGADGETLYLLQVKADQSEVREVEFRYYSARKQEIFHRLRTCSLRGGHHDGKRGHAYRDDLEFTG